MNTYQAQVGSQSVALPIVPLDEGTAIALLITFDHGVAFLQTAGAELAEAIADLRPECIVTAATLGIPVAIEVSRVLGLDDFVVLHKSPKLHLVDAITETLTSITTDGRQQLRLDRARLPAVAGKRVVFVDDVISTGASARAALQILRTAGAQIVGAAALMLEGCGAGDALAEFTTEIRTLGRLPLFEFHDRWKPRLEGDR
ncbi:phosphoribosyltransferase family protein [Mycolicibacterium palauense]|uniref:phosphoribosyltransferase family protein n=1 Tax=Mycolicibacterium palauense TaxID=2034511 RepID=UPI001C3F2E42|nr:phosphoribosyltransferase family protein [Mycolicibacterium palauense]